MWSVKLIGKTPDDDELLLCLLNGISAYPEYAILSTSLKTHKGMTFAEGCLKCHIVGHQIKDHNVTLKTTLESSITVLIFVAFTFAVPTITAF